MRIGSIGARSSGPSGWAPRQAAPAAAAAPESRALVATERPLECELPAAPYREATFLAQLIATKAKLPQTRARRRAEPGEAAAAYRATAALMR